MFIVPRELTASERREIRKLATSMCANYDDYYKECLLLNGDCYMTYGVAYNNSALCKYFRQSVLPLNPKLEAVFAGEPRPEEKQCTICKKLFIPSGRQTYCSLKCKSDGNRYKSRERMKKMRERDSVMLRNSRSKLP